MHIAITYESIHKANAAFWEQMLAMQLQPELSSDEMHSQCIGSEHVAGSCDLSGTWSGRIEVRLSRGLAYRATSAMLMLAQDQVQAADMLDAVKEIANMIAGTLKSALPRPCTMTVPSAQIESSDFCILPQTEDSVTVFFRHSEGELMVRVWEQPQVLENERCSYTQLCA